MQKHVGITYLAPHVEDWMALSDVCRAQLVPSGVSKLILEGWPWWVTCRYRAVNNELFTN